MSPATPTARDRDRRACRAREPTIDARDDAATTRDAKCAVTRANAENEDDANESTTPSTRRGDGRAGTRRDGRATRDATRVRATRDATRRRRARGMKITTNGRSFKRRVIFERFFKREAKEDRGRRRGRGEDARD